MKHQQQTLFNLERSAIDRHSFNPFTSKLYPIRFHDFTKDEPGDVCIYFVLDNVANLVLYIGETKAFNQRWHGEHYCKAYIANYIALHRHYELEVAVNITFWADVPLRKQARRELESSLIYYWQSPFNKEMWEKWGQPFGR